MNPIFSKRNFATNFLPNIFKDKFCKHLLIQYFQREICNHFSAPYFQRKMSMRFAAQYFQPENVEAILALLNKKYPKQNTLIFAKLSPTISPISPAFFLLFSIFFIGNNFPISYGYSNESPSCCCYDSPPSQDSTRGRTRHASRVDWLTDPGTDYVFSVTSSNCTESATSFSI